MREQTHMNIPPLLEDALRWEKVVRWAYEHPASIWAKRVSWHPSTGEFIGESGSSLTSPLACYLNEYTLSVPFHGVWRLGRTPYRDWHERGEPYHITAEHSSNPTQTYPVPLWVERAEYLTDQIQGPRRPGRRPYLPPLKPAGMSKEQFLSLFDFEPAWITQEQFLFILEHVLLNTIPLAFPASTQPSTTTTLAYAQPLSSRNTM